MYNRYYTSNASEVNQFAEEALRRDRTLHNPPPHETPPPPPPPPTFQNIPPPPKKKAKDPISNFLIRDGKIMGAFPIEDAVLIALIVLFLQDEDTRDLAIILAFILLFEKFRR